MNVTALLIAILVLFIAILVLFIVGYGAYVVITKFMPEPLRTPVLAIVGVILLIIILGYATGEISLAGPGLTLR